MKPRATYVLIGVLFHLLVISVKAQDFCNPAGNLVIYSNYDGGILNIQVDENVPDLKIGIVSYEACIVNIAGPFAGNVTGVVYAGWDSPGGCSGVPNSQINGVPPGIVTQYSSENLAISPYFSAPVIPLPGFPPIENCIVSHSDCDPVESPSVVQFMKDEMGPGAVLRSHFTQYGCWTNLDRAISEGGNCCLEAPTTDENPIYQGGSDYDFIAEDTLDLCNGPITLDLSFYPAYVQTPLYPGYVWSDGTMGPVITIDQPGTYSMSVGDACHSPNTYLLEDQVVVMPCTDPLELVLNDIQACPGETITIEALVSGGEEPYAFQWTPNFGAGPGPFTLIAPTNDASFSLTVTDALGNQVSATAVIDIIEDNLSVNLGPDQELCNPPILLNAANTNAVSYSWNTGDSSPTLLIDQPGTYSVTVQGECGSVTDEVEIIDCVDDLTVTLSDETICPGETAVLEAQVFGGLAPFNFEWTPDLGTTAGPFSVSPTSSTTYSITVTDAQGTQVTATATVTVISENLSIDLGPDQELCNPPILLNATNADAVSYLWSTGDTSPTLSVDQPGTYSVTVQGECGSVTDEVEIIDCVDDLTVTLSDETICPGENAILEAQVFGGLAPFTFEWTPDLGTTAGPFSVSPASTTTYSVTVTDVQGTQVTATATVTVVSENLSIDLGPDQELCTPPILLDATNADAVSYLWSTGDTSPTLSVDQPGTYSVTVQGECGSVTDEITLTDCIEPLEVQINGSLSICQGESTILSATVSGGVPPYEYIWSPVDTTSVDQIEVDSDLVIAVNVIDAEGNQAEDEVEVQLIDEDLSLDLGPDSELCDESLSLDASTEDAISYLWNTGETSSSIQVNEPGAYSVEITGQCGANSDIVLIEPCNELEVNIISEGGGICLGDSIILETEISGGTPPYELEWNTGEQTEILIVTPDFSQEYNLTVTDSEGNTESVSTLVQVISSFVETGLPDSLAICSGDTVNLDAEISTGQGYIWNTGSSNSNIEVTQGGIYSVEIETACEIISDEVVVLENDIQWTPINERYLTPCEEDEFITIGVEEIEGLDPVWSDNLNQFQRRVDESGEYILLNLNQCGTDSLKFIVNFRDCECDVYVPNAFTPDSDGLNDIFKPSINCEVDEYTLRIFNRWGEVIFESDNIEKGWNGSSNDRDYFSGPGVYLWQLSYSRKNEESIEEIIEKKGSLTLIR